MILDYIGGDYAEKNIKLLAEDGRMVIIGFLKGPRVCAQCCFSLGKHLVEPHLAEATHDHRLHSALPHSGVQARSGNGDVQQGVAADRSGKAGASDSCNRRNGRCITCSCLLTRWFVLTR